MATSEKTRKAVEHAAKATSDSYRTLLDHTVALQERNVRFAQGWADASVSEFRHQTESNLAMALELVERAEKQRDALRILADESVHAYTDLIFAPFSYYKQDLRLVETPAEARAESNDAFPIQNYDELKIGEISERLGGLNAEQIRVVREYEKKNKNRESLIKQFDSKLRPAS